MLAVLRKEDARWPFPILAINCTIFCEMILNPHRKQDTFWCEEDHLTPKTSFSIQPQTKPNQYKTKDKQTNKNKTQLVCLLP